MIYGIMYPKRRLFLLSIFSIFLICSMPLLPTVEQNKISEEIQGNLQQKINTKEHTKTLGQIQSKINIKQIMQILLFLIKSRVIIDGCVLLTSLFELIILPLSLELGLGPIMFALLMLVLLWIPIQIINGFSLLSQQRYDLSGGQTNFLNNVLLFITLSRIILL
jgi:hypothetical protein